MDDPFFQPVEVFQQPDTRTAVNGRDIELDFRDPVVREIDQSISDLLMVQVGVFPAYFLFFDLYARMVRDVVILAGIVPLEDLINSPATLAAKWLVIEDHGVASAIFTAMVTG
jgi:hypothetical protein